MGYEYLRNEAIIRSKTREFFGVGTVVTASAYLVSVVGQDAAEKAAERQQAPAEKPARERQKKGQGEDPVGLTEPSLAQQDARGDRAAGGEDEAE